MNTINSENYEKTRNYKIYEFYLQLTIVILILLTLIKHLCFMTLSMTLRNS